MAKWTGGQVVGRCGNLYGDRTKRAKQQAPCSPTEGFGVDRAPALPYSRTVFTSIETDLFTRSSMAKKRARNMGAEILEGIRQIKQGELGRVVTFPPATESEPAYTGDQKPSGDPSV